MILLVTMITSSAVFASSLMTKYTICLRDASLFWNSLEIPKKSDVASFVGNFSPVKRRRAILVSKRRHLSGEIGEELNNRATSWSDMLLFQGVLLPTFLEHRYSIYFQDSLFGIFVLFAVTHG